MLVGFDHITIAVADLDAAAASYGRLLGSEPVWRGQNAELGSAGVLFALSNAAVELVAPLPDNPLAEGLRALLAERGEGLQAIAFSTANAQQTSMAFRDRGLRSTPPQPGESVAPDGRVRGYRTVELSARTTRGLSVFAVERPADGRIEPASAPPPAAVSALDHVVIRTADPDAAIELYEKGLGVRLALDRAVGERRMLFFRIGGVTIEIVQDPAAGPNDVFYGAAYRVLDIDAAHARLAAEGFALNAVRDGNKKGTRVFSVRDGTCGVPTLILRDPTRD